MSKIKEENISLNREEVSNFFENRARKFDALNPLTSILYQDKHPEIADRRDALERERVTPLLELTGAESLLDVGCGIGRWGAAIADEVAEYHGIDASPSLIELAKSYAARDNLHFHAAGVDDLNDDWFTKHGPFDRVICSGILIYLDDAQVDALLAGLSRNLAQGGIVYVREPMGMQGRLTLASHWSDELQAHYSAIYRSPTEITSALTEAFPSPIYEITPATLLFEQADLNNRVETQQHFCIIKKSR